MAWICLVVYDIIESRRVIWLDAHPIPPRTYPSVCIVVAARNEGDIIERALSSLLRLDYPDFEVILVDDQSSDGTGEIARKMAKADARLSVINGASLPAGWMGKSWALHQGVGHARGEWLLFTDGDCLHHPQSLQVAMGFALDQQKDFVSLVPALEEFSLPEKLMMPMFTIVLGTLFPPGRLNEHKEKAFAAGGFILVKRPVYESVGGHASIASSIVDDVSLARSVKQSGAAVWTGMTRDLVRTQQYGSLKEVWEGLSKHAFALMGESSKRAMTFVLKAVIFVLGGLLMVGVPMVGFAIGLVEGATLLMGLSAVSFSMMVLLGLGGTWILGIERWWALLLPIGWLLYLLIVVHSVVQVSRGKLVWSGRRYGR